VTHYHTLIACHRTLLYYVRKCRKLILDEKSEKSVKNSKENRWIDENMISARSAKYGNNCWCISIFLQRRCRCWRQNWRQHRIDRHSRCGRQILLHFAQNQHVQIAVSVVRQNSDCRKMWNLEKRAQFGHIPKRHKYPGWEWHTHLQDCIGELDTIRTWEVCPKFSVNQLKCHPWAWQLDAIMFRKVR